MISLVHKTGKGQLLSPPVIVLVQSACQKRIRSGKKKYFEHSCREIEEFQNHEWK